jgi:AcrR family transcriptional regulator
LSVRWSVVAEDAFHTATMDDLARRAGVARATAFSRFGSKLGVLEALSPRCAGGPEMRALREAQAVEDPVAAVDALLKAGCDLWEKEGYIMVQLKAIVVLEPDASAIIDAQYDDQRTGMEALARGLKVKPEGCARAGRWHARPQPCTRSRASRPSCSCAATTASPSRRSNRHFSSSPARSSPRSADRLCRRRMPGAHVARA